MAVNLDDSVIRQFELAGITREQIGKTIERDRAAGLSDEDITLKAMTKADQLKKENPALEGSMIRGSLRAISNLPFGDTINRGIMGVKALDSAYTSVPGDKLKAAYNATLDYLSGNNKPTLRQYLEAPEGTTPLDRSWNQLYHDSYNKIRESKGETFSENYTENMNKLERTFKEQNYDIPKWIRYPLDAGVTIGSYGLLPEGIYETVPRAAAFGAADAYQSGINKESKDRIINALIGGVATGAVTGIMNKVTGKTAMKQAEKEYPLLAEGFKENPPKTTKEAVDRIVDNFMKYSRRDKGGILGERLGEETEKLFGNMDTATLRSVLLKKNKIKGSFIGKAIDKQIKKAPVEEMEGIKERIMMLLSSSGAAKPSTEGLTGGILGALGGGWLGGPVGGIAGAWMGSKGKIGNALSSAGELLLGKSGQRLSKAIVNPQGTNAVIQALRKVPGLTNTIQKATVPVIQNSYEEDKTSYLPSKLYKKTVNQTSNSIPSSLPNTTIILPETSNDESITEKHLKLLAALYPNFYGNVA